MVSCALAVLGVVLLVLGVIVAVRPVATQNTDCGSVLQPAGGVTSMDCADLLNQRTWIAPPAGVAAAISLGACLLVASCTRSWGLSRLRASYSVAFATVSCAVGAAVCWTCAATAR